MLIAAAVDAGVSPGTLEKKLKHALRLKDWRFVISTAEDHGGGKRLSVQGGERMFDSPRAMRKILAESQFTPATKQKILAVFDTITEAEASVHGIAASKIHFHELNALDTIIDIAGGCCVLEELGVQTLLCSPVNIGRIAPAALSIVKQYKIPVWSDTPDRELATPTGIALAARLANGFCSMPVIKVSSSGRGFGQQAIPGKINALQLFIAAPDDTCDAYGSDTVVLIETNIDDMDPRVYSYVTEKLFGAAALDVWLTSIMMKKGRPGTKLSVLCPEAREKAVVDILFTETTTLGVRRSSVQRWILPRSLSSGEKWGILPNGQVKKNKEYRIAVKKAVQSSKPLRSFL